MSEDPIIAGAGEEPARRAASITIGRQSEGRAGQALMDPAHQSLAEALNVMLRLVQAGMILLGVLFLFSGARTVKEGETGIRTLFGDVQEHNLKPGFQFSWPYPIGDLEKVQTGSSRIDIDDERGFWPFLQPNQKAQPIEQLVGGQRLEPGRDGSVITGDGNLAHTQWRVSFRVAPETAREYVQNMPADEATRDRIVQALAKRAIVHSIANVSIDQLLKESPRGEGSLAYEAQQKCQQWLDDMDSGISIESLDLQAKMPPLAARDDFNRVASAESKRKQDVEEARQESNKILSSTAGQAWEAANRLILDYEAATDARAGAQRDGNEREMQLWEQRQTAVMADLVALFEGATTGGRVAQEINSARLYRSAEGQRRRADVARFNAIRAQYEQNPLVTIHREWATAFRTMIARDNVQLVMLPPGARSMGLWINQDPEIARSIEEAVKRRKLAETQKAREEDFNRGQFRTDTSVQEMEGR